MAKIIATPEEIAAFKASSRGRFLAELGGLTALGTLRVNARLKTVSAMLTETASFTDSALLTPTGAEGKRQQSLDMASTAPKDGWLARQGGPQL